MKHKFPILGLKNFLGLFVIFVSSPLYGEVIANINIGGNASGASPASYYYSATSGMLSYTKEGSGSVTSQSTAYSDFGLMSTDVSIATNTNDSFSYQVSASATWHDSFTIAGSGTGFVTVAYRVNGYNSVDSGSGAQSTYSSLTGSVGGSSESITYEILGNGLVYGSDYKNQTRTLTTQFTFGTEVEFSLTIFDLSKVVADNVGESSASLSSFVWEGIVSVKDSDNNEVTDYTTTSSSGKDLSVAAVPEPSTYALLIIGGLAFFFLRSPLFRRNSS